MKAREKIGRRACCTLAGPTASKNKVSVLLQPYGPGRLCVTARPCIISLNLAGAI
jgi:hypothetical protein